jgi:hypothetical protein
VEVGGFVERERCYDDFSNLLYRFESIVRTKRDDDSNESGALLSFYRHDLLKTGSMVSRTVSGSDCDSLR